MLIQSNGLSLSNSAADLAAGGNEQRELCYDFVCSSYTILGFIPTSTPVEGYLSLALKLSNIPREQDPYSTQVYSPPGQPRTLGQYPPLPGGVCCTYSIFAPRFLGAPNLSSVPTQQISRLVRIHAIRRAPIMDLLALLY